MIVQNPRANRQPWDPALQSLLSLQASRAARARLAGWRVLCEGATPAWSLPGLAAALGVSRVTIKDESQRSSLASFKVLGAPNALLLLLARRRPELAAVSPAELLAGAHASALGDFTVIAATDGNHGRGLAAAAHSVGCRCVIVLHALVSDEREHAIAALGATIVRVAGNYDDSVAEAERLARTNGWEVVSDTSYEGYQDVPRDVMQGYGVIVDELLEHSGTSSTGDCPWTHVLLQGGVGAFPAGIVGPLWQRFGAARPRFIVVEPEQADCLLQSALQGRPARASGDTHSLMAGLACGETSALAWRFLQPVVDAFVTVPDAQAEQAMRVLAEGRHGDVPIVAGESGAAGLAGLQALRGDAAAWQSLALDADAHVLLINTEGATAPSLYARHAGRDHAQVLAAQQAWLRAHP